MECKDYIEAIAADPHGSFEGNEHAATCEGCRQFHNEMLALDEQIAQALDIPVPDLAMPELPAIGEQDATVANLPFRRMGKSRTPIWLGLAASMVFATVLGMTFFAEKTSYSSLGAEIMAHLDHETRALRVTDKSVSERKLNNVLEDGVAAMDRDVGLISYAVTCVINGNEIPHLVIQGERGPITVLLLPDEKIEAAIPLYGESTEGIILPVGDGSIAIVGSRGERLGDLEERLVDSVKWSI